MSLNVNHTSLRSSLFISQDFPIKIMLWPTFTEHLSYANCVQRLFHVISPSTSGGCHRPHFSDGDAPDVWKCVKMPQILINVSAALSNSKERMHLSLLPPSVCKEAFSYLCFLKTNCQ